jgi:hypothetical protein
MPRRSFLGAAIAASLATACSGAAPDPAPPSSSTPDAPPPVVQAPLPPPPPPPAPAATGWSKNVRVSFDGELGFEPAVAADAAGHVVVPYVTMKPPSPSMAVAVSSDHGDTWTRAFQHATPGGMSGDVAAASDDRGAFYVAWISYHFSADGKSVGPCDVMVAASHDSGATWSAPVVASSGTADGGSWFNDRPWITVTSDGAVHVLVSHGASEDGARAILVASHDGGATWSAPLAAVSSGAASSGMELASFGLGHAGADVVVPYADFRNETTITAVGMLRLAGGASAVADAASVALQPPLVSLGSYDKGFPTFAGSCFGYIQPDDDGNHAYVARTTDGGRTLGAPVRVDAAGVDEDRLTATADGDGRCFLVWIDSRSGAQELRAATLEDDGAMAPSRKVNDAAMNLGPDQTSQGEDYLSASFGGDRAYVAWADRRATPQAIYLSSLRR